VKRSPEIASLFLDIGGVLFTDGWGYEYRTDSATEGDTGPAPRQVA